MAYATLAELREMLVQVPEGSDNDTLLGKMLDRATAIVDRALGFSFAAYGASATAKDVRARVTGDYLYLPIYLAGSVASVYSVSDKARSTESTTLVSSWVAEEDERPYRLYRGGDGWWRGTWYRVTAKWGYGPAPEDIKLVTLELAVNLWGSRDSRMISDVVGVEGGGAVGYNRALTNRQRLIVDDVRTQYGEWGIA